MAGEEVAVDANVVIAQRGVRERDHGIGAELIRLRIVEVPNASTNKIISKDSD